MRRMGRDGIHYAQDSTRSTTSHSLESAVF